MTFREFLQLGEAGTTTADVAGFSRVTVPPVRRAWPSDPEAVDYYDWNPKKKKKPYRVPQLEESAP